MFKAPNTSQTSLASTKEKELPPIPSETRHGEDPPLLAPKSLNRKNVKHLSFTPPSPAPPADYSGEFSRFERLDSPQKKNRLRPAPLLNLHSPSKAPQPTIIDSLQGLELAEPAVGAASTQRKRQTVISSISPTRSVYTPSPREASSPGFTSASSHTSPLPTTPVSTVSSSHSIRDEDLVHLKDLGAGNFGVVSKVVHVPSSKTMAKKIVHVDSKPEVQTQIIRELRIMHECRSPYIIEFYGAFARSNNAIVICMEYCNCGSLDKIVQLCDPPQFPLFVLRKLSYAILSGLNYLYHTHRIIHRDIKPSNVLMTHRGDFKLCDFGVSRELTNSLAMADTFVGTSTYMSPERIQGLTYGVRSDVWSMGLMLYELASGQRVWYEDDVDDGGSRPAGPEGILDLLQRIVNEKSPTLTGKSNRYTHEPYNADLCDFVDHCLVKNDQQRSSPQELLQEPLLDGVAQGVYDKEVRAWAKVIRKRHKERNGHD
ncbi:putative mitogen-activated protein kinase kinase [Clavispora lusitaniae]|uniref:Mitogen-activated protein kinase kinase n=1 Tax=Clavispora lusitaniae TaxID=36911 RepID=A0AA91PWU3_CLALS|nr:putative mitogen-activated protein kinase kinase [Clavispora lusitaniae]